MKLAPCKCKCFGISYVVKKGANRYRNPDEDLPADFEDCREENYKALNQPLDI
jgi:hypothetical protein